MKYDENLVIVATDLAYQQQAIDLAAELAVPWCLNKAPEGVLMLQIDANGLGLGLNERKAPGLIRVDFVQGALAHRLKYGGGRKQDLPRAVGMKRGVNPRVIDATAGLGRDSVVLASLGCEMTMLERSPIVVALLQDALRRACLDDELAEWVPQRLKLITQSSIEYLKGVQHEDADTIYMDPMYPERSKSALVKKEMRIIRDVVGDDVDADELLAMALATGVPRVVVKRPKGAEALPGPTPSLVKQGKSTRYDIYFP